MLSWYQEITLQGENSGYKKNYEQRWHGESSISLNNTSSSSSTNNLFSNSELKIVNAKNTHKRIIGISAENNPSLKRAKSSKSSNECTSKSKNFYPLDNKNSVSSGSR